MSPRHYLFIDPPADGRWNMAVDSYIAHELPLSVGEIALRLYRWSPAAYTVGRNQSWSRALSLDGLIESDMAIRRITGGRAIYHDESELTYAFALQEENPYDSDARLGLSRTREISSQVALALRASLRGLGLAAEITRSSGVGPHKQNEVSDHCFASVARHEVTINGAKVAAGAQVIVGGRFFQHGSIKLDHGGGGSALVGRHQPRLLSETSSIVDSENLADSCRSGFAEVFGPEWTPATWKSEDLSAITRLCNEQEVYRKGASDLPTQLTKRPTTDLIPVHEVGVSGGPVISFSENAWETLGSIDLGAHWPLNSGVAVELRNSARSRQDFSDMVHDGDIR